jgi:DNA polymerase-3 subunit gamma/tau
MESLLFENEVLDSGNSNNYLVLARKYRPTTFSDMIGQDVLIKTFTNAVTASRIAHAFLLTGIRGVGKTTTARIIARALNCIGEDEKGPITIDPCGKCYHCKAIADDRHQDVIEIDAASHTGVNEIRDIIENARYRPISARFKLYIIDEVHMLSNSAFNALLKTLEEPPMHVKFIFATTEIRKIPLTILSRCQRFDLKRVGMAELTEHFKNVLGKEGFKASDDCLRMIAKAAHGSVRDGLSILDQAISHTGGNIDENAVREMLGLSSNEDLYRLYGHLLKNETAQCLEIIERLYAYGSDPMLILQDLMGITHALAKAKTDINSLNVLSECDGKCVRELLEITDISRINRIWLALSKGFDELKNSPTPLSSLEMVLIRIVHLSNLPSPEDLMRKLKARTNDEAEQKSNKQDVQDVQAPVAHQRYDFKSEANVISMHDREQLKYGGALAENAVCEVSNQNISNDIKIESMEDIEQLLFTHDEMVMCHHLRSDVKLVKLEPNRLAIRLLEGAPKTFNNSLKAVLERVTGENWVVLSSSEEGEPTLSQKERACREQQVMAAKEHPAVVNMLNSFTGLEIADIKFKNNV